MTDYLQIARDVITTEAEVLKNMALNLDENFNRAIKIILNTKGRLVITGMGKSGHIANKIAATFSSTGTPSFAVHPAELIHGDLGMITNDDSCIVISNSGETKEISQVLPHLSRRNIKIIGITSVKGSTLDKLSDTTILLYVNKEACPLNLAPTSSTTATLALGDALAVALMKHKNFTRNDFAEFHPGGSLGQHLLKVSDIMKMNEHAIPMVKDSVSYEELIKEINDKGLGFVCLINSENKLNTVISDGDLRRALVKYGPKVFNMKALEIKNSMEPKVISEDATAFEGFERMKEYKISKLVIIDQEKNIKGILDLQDLLRAPL